MPRTPMTFQPREWPKLAATCPAASAGLQRERRPIMNSAMSIGVAMARHARMNTNTKAPPPFAPVRYGNRQMLPSPTAAPTAVHYLQGLGRRFGPWAPEDESTASAQDEQSTASKNGVTMNVSIYGYLLTVTAYLPCLPNSLISGGVQTFN